MPDYRDVAPLVFGKTRELYTGGLKRIAWTGFAEDSTPPGPGKSPNKMVLNEANKDSTAVIGIHDDSEIRDTTFELRRSVASAAYMSTSSAESPEGIPIHYGQELINLRVAGLNCGELAAIAAYLAWKELGAKATAPDVAVARLSDPGDHGWCLIGPHTALAAINGQSIAALKGFTHSDGDAFVIDAWTNLCCPIGDFHDKVHEKLMRWMVRGKRISWMGKTGNKKGWYPPVGDYTEVFVSAAIKLQYGLDPED